jgi:hypothetical protein
MSQHRQVKMAELIQCPGANSATFYGSYWRKFPLELAEDPTKVGGVAHDITMA